jgi:fructosamine-3-kinase
VTSLEEEHEGTAHRADDDDRHIDDWPADLPPIASKSLLKGGFVASTWRARLADGTETAVKVTPFPADAEADGLQALAAAGVPAPKVLGALGHTIVMELVAGPPDWSLIGRAIAGMHQVRGERYGWHRDNYGGMCVQPNGWLDDWPTFFVERRVLAHLDDPLVPVEFRRRLERACNGPIQDLLPERPVPVLTHGDLWLGNVVEGRWVVDPEVSFADRELDLAYMQMSVDDPFPAAFWDAYLEELPLPEGFESRRRVLELHHRLLIVRHFGERALGPLDELLTEYGW